MGKSIFRADGRAVIVPIDHGLGGVITGWEEPAKTLAQVVAGGPDAVMTTFGNLKRYRHLLDGKVATLLRLDAGPSPYGLEPGKPPAGWRQLYSVEDAMRLGAAGVRVTCLFGTPTEMACIEMVGRIAAECQRHGILLCVETYPVAGPKVPAGEILHPKHVAAVCRLAYELGADFIKTHYTGSAETFRQVTRPVPVPVLMAGGPKVETEFEILDQVRGMLKGGGAGVWCGRNVFQHHDPAAMVHALVEVVHNEANLEEALDELRGVERMLLTPS